MGDMESIHITFCSGMIYIEGKGLINITYSKLNNSISFSGVFQQSLVILNWNVFFKPDELSCN